MATKIFVSEVRVLKGTNLIASWGRTWAVTATGTAATVGTLADTFTGFVVKMSAVETLTVLARIGADNPTAAPNAESGTVAIPPGAQEYLPAESGAAIRVIEAT